MKRTADSAHNLEKKSKTASKIVKNHYEPSVIVDYIITLQIQLLFKYFDPLYKNEKEIRRQALAQVFNSQNLVSQLASYRQNIITAVASRKLTQITASENFTLRYLDMLLSEENIRYCLELQPPQTDEELIKNRAPYLQVFTEVLLAGHNAQNIELLNKIKKITLEQMIPTSYNPQQIDLFCQFDESYRTLFLPPIYLPDNILIFFDDCKTLCQGGPKNFKEKYRELLAKYPIEQTLSQPAEHGTTPKELTMARPTHAFTNTAPSTAEQQKTSHLRTCLQQAKNELAEVKQECLQGKMQLLKQEGQLETLKAMCRAQAERIHTLEEERQAYHKLLEKQTKIIETLQQNSYTNLTIPHSLQWRPLTFTDSTKAFTTPPLASPHQHAERPQRLIHSMASSLHSVMPAAASAAAMFAPTSSSLFPESDNYPATSAWLDSFGNSNMIKIESIHQEPLFNLASPSAQAEEEHQWQEEATVSTGVFETKSPDSLGSYTKISQRLLSPDTAPAVLSIAPVAPSATTAVFPATNHFLVKSDESATSSSKLGFFEDSTMGFANQEPPPVSALSQVEAEGDNIPMFRHS